MAYLLSEINRRASEDPVKFLRECDEAYERQLEAGAKRIIAHSEESPIVFVSGPSGSGKTTTALKLEQHMEARGAETHIVALDNYFRTVNPEDYPGLPQGNWTLNPPTVWTPSCWRNTSTLCTGDRKSKSPGICSKNSGSSGTAAGFCS